jgi:Calcineurin-like phosphoesterase
MPAERLVRPLFEGPIDIVGDVHGEIDALESLLGRLGYRSDGSHAQRRRLVFLGDLVDRGPDSVGVVRRVKDLVQLGRAQCVLGNHELNIFLERKKEDNTWFFGHSRTNAAEEAGPHVQATEPFRKEAINFFKTLPLALERIGMRVVHACWHPTMIELVRHETDVCSLFRRSKEAIRGSLDERAVADEIDRELADQNENPVKVLTSGVEEPAPEKYYLNGKWRQLRRGNWWHDYSDRSWCVVGHYSRRKLPGEDGGAGDRLIPVADLLDRRQYGPLGASRVMCIDYSVGYRWKERKTVGANGPFVTRLAALRVPEMALIFEDGSQEMTG